MVTATTWTITSAAIVALTGSVLWAAPSGGTTGSDLSAPGQYGPAQWGPGMMGPGMMDPGEWG